MFKNLRNNPLLVHQIRNARWPSPRTAVLIAVGLTVIGLALTTTNLVIHPSGPMSFSSLIILPVELLLLAFGPLVTVVVTVAETVPALDTEAYQMMRLSQLSERDIVGGYAASAAFQMRALWMTAGGLALPLIPSLTHIVMVLMIAFACTVEPMEMDSNCIPPDPSEIVLQHTGAALILTVCYVGLFIAWNWLAVALGVWMAFRHRRTARALVGAFPRLVIAIALQIGMVILFSARWDWPGWVLLLFVVGVNPVLGWWAYQQAVKCVRSMAE